MQKSMSLALLPYLVAFIFLPFSIPSVCADVIDESAAPASAKEEVVTEELAVTEDTGPIKEEPAAEPAISSEQIAPEATEPVSTVEAAAAAPTEEKICKTQVRVNGGGFFLKRKEYKLIQTQDEGAAPALQRASTPFPWQLSGAGSFGDVAVEHALNDKISVEGSFLGSVTDRKQSRNIPGGTPTQAGTLISNASVLPLLRNVDPFRVVAGFNVGNAIEIGGRPENTNAEATADFFYESKQYDTAVDLICNNIGSLNLHTVKNIRVDGIAGFGYTRIAQDFTLKTEGINVNNIGVTKTNTSEFLTDNLFGGRIGARAHAKLDNNVLLNTKLVAGFYGDSVRYDGLQDIHNASFVGFLGNHDFQVRQILDADRFVPRLDVHQSIGIPLNQDLTIEITYVFSSFWNLSNIVHPEVVVKQQSVTAFNDQIDNEVRIGTENVAQHYLGLRLAWKF